MPSRSCAFQTSRTAARTLRRQTPWLVSSLPRVSDPGDFTRYRGEPNAEQGSGPPSIGAQDSGEQRHSQRPGRGTHAPVVARQVNVHAALAQELGRRQVQRIEGAHMLRKRLEGSFENQWRQLDERDRQELPRRLAMAGCEPRACRYARLRTRAVGWNHHVGPHRGGGTALLDQQMGESHRAVVIIIGLRRLIELGEELLEGHHARWHRRRLARGQRRRRDQPLAGPRRRAERSATALLRPASGGPSWSTTRSRSEISTVSPAAARRYVLAELVLPSRSRPARTRAE